MVPATVDTPEREQRPTARDRVIDAYRQTAHLSHEVRLLKSVAEDAIKDGVHAAKRALKSVQRSVEHLEDMRDEAVHRVKRQPIGAVGIALGIGLVVGYAVGWIAHRSERHE
jgi:ElaB/YqjD/DUF883 family membrane-anchored ribosome-binding protein